MQALRGMAEARSQYGVELGGRGQTLQSGINRTQMALPDNRPTPGGMVRGAANEVGNSLLFQSEAARAKKNMGG